MHELKTYRRVICHDNEEWFKMGRGIDLSIQNWHEDFDEFWPKHSKISKICTLMGCLWPKFIMLELKKYSGVMRGSTEYWCKTWRKIHFCFQKWHEEFGKFQPEHSKVSKMGLWWDNFVQSRKCVSLKLTGSYLSWEWKKMQHWKRNWLFVSKLRWELWWILTWALKNLKNFHFNGLPFWPKYITFDMKKHRGVMFDGTEY